MEEKFSIKGLPQRFLIPVIILLPFPWVMLSPEVGLGSYDGRILTSLKMVHRVLIDTLTTGFKSEGTVR